MRGAGEMGANLCFQRGGQVPGEVSKTSVVQERLWNTSARLPAAVGRSNFLAMGCQLGPVCSFAAAAM